MMTNYNYKTYYFWHKILHFCKKFYSFHFQVCIADINGVNISEYINFDSSSVHLHKVGEKSMDYVQVSDF